MINHARLNELGISAFDIGPRARMVFENKQTCLKIKKATPRLSYLPVLNDKVSRKNAFSILLKQY